jgi:hypothetical protein
MIDSQVDVVVDLEDRRHSMHFYMTRALLCLMLMTRIVRTNEQEEKITSIVERNLCPFFNLVTIDARLGDIGRRHSRHPHNFHGTSVIWYCLDRLCQRISPFYSY